MQKAVFHGLEPCLSVATSLFEIFQLSNVAILLELQIVNFAQELNALG